MRKNCFCSIFTKNLLVEWNVHKELVGRMEYYGILWNGMDKIMNEGMGMRQSVNLPSEAHSTFALCITFLPFSREDERTELLFVYAIR